MELVIYIPIFCYFVFATTILWGWTHALSKTNKPKTSINKPVSILIPFRNEADRISPLILSIKMVADKFPTSEFIFVDDHSDDHSVRLLQSEFSGFPQVKIVQLHETLGKKSAIAHGISVAKHAFIITTDADCELTESALRNMIRALLDEQTQMVCGPVFQFSGKGFGARLADLEFLSLIGSGISFFGLNIPFMANGAFLGFKKMAFEKVNGFAENEQFPGGDDVFLLQKIQCEFGNNSILFLTESQDIIQTKGDQSFNEFMKRRIRWGAKAKAYQSNSSKFITLYIFSINTLLLVAYFYAIFSHQWPVLFIGISIKIWLDFIMLSSFIIRLKKWFLLPFIIPASILHPFYILFTAALALWGKYDWKKRNYGIS